MAIHAAEALAISMGLGISDIVACGLDIPGPVSTDILAMCTPHSTASLVSAYIKLWTLREGGWLSGSDPEHFLALFSGRENGTGCFTSGVSTKFCLYTHTLCAQASRGEVIGLVFVSV